MTVRGERRTDGARIVKDLVTHLGGRFGLEMGIDVDAGPHEVDRWFLASSLFGTRISARIVVRTYQALDDAGLATVDLVGKASRPEIIRLLDAGGYARYDERTATRLGHLAARAREAFPHGVDAWGRACGDASDLLAGLDALPGWGPVTVRAFLRELRGTWPLVDLDPDTRAGCAAEHLRIVAGGLPLDRQTLLRLAALVNADPRDVEAALIRYDLEYRHRRP